MLFRSLYLFFGRPWDLARPNDNRRELDAEWQERVLFLCPTSCRLFKGHDHQPYGPPCSGELGVQIYGPREELIGVWRELDLYDDAGDELTFQQVMVYQISSKLGRG